ALAQEIGVAMPGMDLAKRVEAENQADLEARVGVAQRVHGVDRVRRAGAFELAGFDLEMRCTADRELEHATAIIRCGDVVCVLVRRLGRQQQPDLFEAGAFAPLLGRAQVTEMDGIEAAAEEADPARRPALSGPAHHLVRRTSWSSARARRAGRGHAAGWSRCR